MAKLLLIALDGATLDLLQPWMAAGNLPLLSRLFQEGNGGVLESTIPWATPTAFASFTTGTNPGQHGVFDFGRLIGNDYTAFVPTNGADVKQPTLWRLLSDAGISSLILNMPMTYPAEAIHGWLVAGIPYPAHSPRLCYPPDLLTDLRQRGWDLARNASDDLGGSYTDYYQGLLQLMRQRGEAAAHLIRQHNPDFVCAHFLETDQVQHRYWQFLPGEPRYDPAGAHTNAILSLYQEAERAMQQIIDAAGENVTLCVMSDHGFGPSRHQVWPNNWLLQHGYLVLKNTPGVRLKRFLYRLGLSPAAIREKAPERLKLAILQFFERQKGRALASQLEGDDSRAQRKGALDRLIERLAIDFYDVDWSRTVAFSTGSTSVGYVFLNVKEHDPQGIVSPGAEYETKRAEIAARLRQWPAVGEVKMREEVWRGSQVERAPDLVIHWAADSTDARYFQTRFSSHHLLKSVPNDYASHRRNGLFLFHGQHVRQGQLDANILDLTPTLLWLLQQPVPSHMDGRVLTECFTLDRPVLFTHTTQAIDKTDFALTPDDEAAIMDALRALGYIE